eukprot:163111-Chlamydomonas_euryale.AAC.1
MDHGTPRDTLEPSRLLSSGFCAQPRFELWIVGRVSRTFAYQHACMYAWMHACMHHACVRLAGSRPMHACMHARKPVFGCQLGGRPMHACTNASVLLAAKKQAHACNGQSCTPGHLRHWRPQAVCARTICLQLCMPACASAHS